MAHQQQPLLQHSHLTLAQAHRKLDQTRQAVLTRGLHPNQVIH